MDNETLDMLGPEIAPAALPGLVGADTMADLLGLSTVRVSALARDGVIPRTGRDYPVREGVRAYCAWVRTHPAGRPAAGGALAEARIRLTAAQADRAELQAAASRGEFVAAAAVEAGWAAILRDVRAAILALPSRIRARAPHLTVQDVAEIDYEARAVLTELAHGT